MEIQDSTAFGQQAVRVGLINEAQLREALEEAREEDGKQVPDLIRLKSVLERKGYLTSFQCGKVLKGDDDGYFLGGYRLLYKIASGSFGRVFRAVDPASGRVVAIKVLRRRWSEDQARIDQFIREGKVGMSLKHPNIVEVLQVSQDPVTKQYYFVMEFVEGGNLRQILQLSKTMSVADALRIAEDSAAGLAYAYSRGITHRDIKLTNILVSTTKEAKLVDFGLAQMFAALGHEDEHHDRTVDYAGLERATGVNSGDVRSDIYFLGCVLYEALTGRSPLKMDKDRHARMRKQRFEEVQPLRPGEVQAPPSVYHLVETMMALSPQRRYQTPSQLLDAVRAARREALAGQAGPAGKGEAGAARPAARTLFLVERDVRLQNTLREKFKEKGFRVFVAADPLRAVDRFRQQPFDVLVVNAGTVGEDGLMVCERILMDSDDKRIPCAAVVLLTREQADWVDRVPAGRQAAALVQPITLKQLLGKVGELLNGSGG